MDDMRTVRAASCVVPDEEDHLLDRPDFLDHLTHAVVRTAHLHSVDGIAAIALALTASL